MAMVLRKGGTLIAPLVLSFNRKTRYAAADKRVYVCGENRGEVVQLDIHCLSP